MMTALLTIAIPTYNRGEQLLRTLGRLLPQLDERCELLVIDNHSDHPVAAVLAGVTSTRPEVPVRIIRNPSNAADTPRAASNTMSRFFTYGSR